MVTIFGKKIFGAPKVRSVETEKLGTKVGPISKQESASTLEKMRRSEGYLATNILALKDSRYRFFQGSRRIFEATQTDLIGAVMIEVLNSGKREGPKESEIKEIEAARLAFVEEHVKPLLESFRSGNITLGYLSDYDANNSFIKFVNIVQKLNGGSGEHAGSLIRAFSGGKALPLGGIKMIDSLYESSGIEHLNSIKDTEFSLLGYEEIGSSREEVLGFAKTLCINYGKELLATGNYSKLLRHINDSEISLEEVGTTEDFVGGEIKAEESMAARGSAKRALKEYLSKLGVEERELGAQVEDLIEKL